MRGEMKRKGREYLKRLSVLPGACSRIICFLLSHLLFLSLPTSLLPPRLLVLLTARDNQWCAGADCFSSCFKIVLSCLSSAGGEEEGDPFTDPLLFHLSRALARRSSLPIDPRPCRLVTQIELGICWIRHDEVLPEIKWVPVLESRLNNQTQG